MSAGVRFADRSDAGRQLAAALKKIPLHDAAVYALPRGGVPVAAEVAAQLDAPLDLVLVRKLGAPGQPELAVGAIVDGDEPEILINEDIAASTGANAAYLGSVQEDELREIQRRRAVYLGERAPVNPLGRDVIVVDDGIATGASMLAAVRSLKHRGARRVIVATPLAPPETVARLQAEADLVVCLAQPEWFPGISAFYDDFHQLADREVVELLRKSAGRAEKSGSVA